MIEDECTTKNMVATQHLLDFVHHDAARADALSTTDVYVVIGRLTPMIADSVQCDWDTLTRDTPATDTQSYNQHALTMRDFESSQVYRFELLPTMQYTRIN